MNSGSSGSCKRFPLAHSPSPRAPLREKREHVSVNKPQVKPFLQPPSSLWAASQAAKAGSGQERPRPPSWRRRSRKTWRSNSLGFVTWAKKEEGEGDRERLASLVGWSSDGGAGNTLVSLSLRREVGLSHSLSQQWRQIFGLPEAVSLKSNFSEERRIV